MLFMAFTVVTLLFVYWLTMGQGLKVSRATGLLPDYPHIAQDTTGHEVAGDDWKYRNIYLVGKLIDDYPLSFFIFFGIVALVNAVTALMYLTTPANARNVRYTQGEDEVLVNLDAVATAMQSLLDAEPDVHYARVMLRVPTGKQLRINCYVRLDLEEQANLPGRIEQLRERLKTYFDQTLPLEAKFVTSMELKVVPIPQGRDRDAQRTHEVEADPTPAAKDFQGPRYPIDA
jgi:hypothetical protein